MLSWLLVATRLFVVTVVMWWGVMLSDEYIQQCSRRLANLTFVLWMVKIYVCSFFAYRERFAGLNFYRFYLVKFFTGELLWCLMFKTCK